MLGLVVLVVLIAGGLLGVALASSKERLRGVRRERVARVLRREHLARGVHQVIQRRDTSHVYVPGQIRPGEQHKLPTTGPAWTFIGPRPVNDPFFGGSTGLVSGRVTSLATLPASPFDIYAGTADGGVWKSTDQGVTWIPITDNGPNLSIGALASDTTSSAVYAGTGEDNFNADRLPGVGILRLINTSITNVAPSLAGASIGGIAIDRTTAHASLRLFAATSVGLYGSIGGNAGSWNPNPGFDSTVVADGLTSHATGVIQDFTSASKFFVTVGDNCRNGDTTAAVLESTNHGTSWSSVFTVAPASRLALASAPHNTEYAIGAQCNGNIYNIWKSIAGGAPGTWHSIAATFPIDLFNPAGGTGQGWYDIAAAADPTDATGDTAVFEGVDALATQDGGNTLHVIGNVYNQPPNTEAPIHPDFHAILFTGFHTFYAGNDGGVWRTTDLGGTGTLTDWTGLNNTLGTTQFYAGSSLDSHHVFGGAQDNGNSGFFNGPTTTWPKYTFAGDGFFTAIDYTVGSTDIFGEFSQLGLLQGDSTAQSTSNLWGPCGLSSNGNCGTAAFSAPFVLDPSNPKRLLGGTRNLFESKDSHGNYTGGGAGGSFWTQIGSNLTYGTAHPFEFNQNDTISSISVAPKGESDVIYTLSAQGAAFRTLDDGKTFQNISSGLPPANPNTATAGMPWGSQIAVNPWDTDEAWVAITGSKVGHVWHTTDGGFSWHDITGNLGDLAVSSVLPDPREKNTIFIGAANGVYVCTTCGGGAAIGLWQHYGTGLPPVWVSELTMSRDTKQLVAWTHGRSAWTIPTALPISTNTVTEFPTSGPTGGIANGPNGVWFTEGTKVGVAAIDGTIKEYTIPGASQLQDITLGSDGNMWFTDSGSDFVGTISPTGTLIRTIPLQPGGHARGIASGPDGNIYVCDPNLDQIYVFDTSGNQLTRQHVATTSSRPYEIVNGNDGFLYFTEFTANINASSDQVGVITPNGSSPTFTEIAAPNLSTGPLGIGLGPDGHVWYAEWGNSHVGTFTSSGPSSGVQEFSVGSLNHQPSAVTTGYDRNLWLAMQSSSALARFDTTTHTVTKTYPTPSSPYELITGPDGNIWYTTQSNTIGRLELSLS